MTGYFTYLIKKKIHNDDVGVRVELREKSWFSQSGLGSGTRTQIIRLGSRRLYLLNHIDFGLRQGLVFYIRLTLN